MISQSPDSSDEFLRILSFDAVDQPTFQFARNLGVVVFFDVVDEIDSTSYNIAGSGFNDILLVVM
jgi:hypothetical protein